MEATDRKATAILGKVTVGDEEITVTRFRAHKAILAGALVKRVMAEIPEINKNMDDFRKEYRANNFFEITADMAKMPRFQEEFGIKPEDFEGRQGEPIKLPANPDGQAMFMHVFPELFDLTQRELRMFLALIVIPDKELERADEADQIDEVLERRGKELIREGYIDEILELCVVGWEVLQDQIVRKRDRLGKLQDIPILGSLLSTLVPQTMESDEKQTQETSTPESQNLSTDSPDSTDGADEKSSTESPGTSSSSSSLSIVS